MFFGDLGALESAPGGSRTESAIAQSACTEIMMASGPSRRAISCAAHVSAAAVPPARGSAMRFARESREAASAIAGTKTSLVSISTRSGGAMGCSRATASASNGSLVTRGRSCFGRLGVLRRPEPRADTAGENHGPAPHAVSPVASSVADSHELGGSCVELLRAERLRQKVVRAELHGAGVLLFLASRSENDARAACATDRRRAWRLSTSRPLRCGIIRSSSTRQMSGSRSSTSSASRPS